MTARIVLGALTALLVACSQKAALPRAQALLYVDSDMHVPRMANRLQLSIVDQTGALRCSQCRREVAITDTTEWPISFGIEPPTDGARVYVRAVLYLAGRTSAGAPLAATAVERIAEVRFGTGVVAQDLFLSSDCTGIASDPIAGTTCVALDAAAVPIAVAAAHVDAPSRIRTWQKSIAAPCASEARLDSGTFDGDACVPGGAYFMGDFRKQGFGPSFDAVPEHAVALSSFYLDTHEFTVGRYRAALAAGFKPPQAPVTNCFDPTIKPPPTREKISATPCWYCNLAPLAKLDADAEARPLNCVTAQTAEMLCAHEGRRLPTEAEWEWAAGSREKELLYTWGDSFIECDEAKGQDPRKDDCFAIGESEVLLNGHGAPKVTDVPFDKTIDGIYGMSGGVAEWVADTFRFYDAPCWQPGAYTTDPRCTDAGGEAPRRSMRGTHFWTRGSGEWAVTHRASLPPSSKSFTTGFRCARNGSE